MACFSFRHYIFRMPMFGGRLRKVTFFLSYFFEQSHHDYVVSDHHFSYYRYVSAKNLSLLLPFVFLFFNFCSVLDRIFIHYFLVKAFQYTLFVPHMQFCHFSYSINFLVPFLFLKAQPWYSFFSLICLLIFFDLLLKLKILTFS